MADGRVMHVDIQGQRYAIRSELDAKYINDLAAYVDERMERVGRELASTDGVRLAVLAALNIADELFRARDDSSGATSQLLSRAADIERMVDAALAAAADAGAIRPAATLRTATS
jgi:cell division protein ZapA